MAHKKEINGFVVKLFEVRKVKELRTKNHTVLTFLCKYEQKNIMKSKKCKMLNLDL